MSKYYFYLLQRAKGPWPPWSKRGLGWYHIVGPKPIDLTFGFSCVLSIPICYINFPKGFFFFFFVGPFLYLAIRLYVENYNRERERRSTMFVVGNCNYSHDKFQLRFNSKRKLHLGEKWPHFSFELTAEVWLSRCHKVKRTRKAKPI